MIHPKLALRTLLATPLVTAVVVASLGLGIGANVAIFSLFEKALLRPLPVPEPERLVNFSAPGPNPGSQSCNQAGDCQTVFSYPMFRDLERVQTSFTGIGAHRSFGANLSYEDRTESGSGMQVSGSYFSVLGLTPALGRLLDSSDDRSVGAAPVAVLSHAYWRRRFNEDAAVLGRPLVVNGQVMTIVGVATPGFEGTTLGAPPDVFVPITMRGLLDRRFDGFEDRRDYWVYLFGRLRPGVTIEEASAAVNVPFANILDEVEAPLQRGMSEQTMARFKAKRIVLEDGARGQSRFHGEARAPLTLLLGVTVLVLLIACANIANLLLARGVARAKELTVRVAIGASRAHLVAQLLTEALLIAAFGGLLGLAVAHGTLHVLASLLPEGEAAALGFSIDAAAALYTAGLTLVTALGFGLFPAVHGTRSDLVTVLKGQGGQASGARAASRFRTALAAAQVALSMVLLVSAGLFTKSLLNVSRVELGLRTDHLITFGISPEQNGYTPEESRGLFERLEDELGALPGVRGVTAAMVPVLSGNSWGSDVTVEGIVPEPDTNMNSRRNEVGPEYFRTLGIPLLSGREFTRADALSAPLVAIVNEQFAKKFELGRDAVGKRMGLRGRGGALDMEIVGLARDAKYDQVKQEVPPLFFLPYRQNPELGFLSFYVRTASAPEPFLAAIQRVVAAEDPDLPVENLRTLAMQVEQNVFLDRFLTVLSAAFAGLATLLAAVGLYGVLAYTVARRTREIGLRMALGAAPGRVRGMVLRQVAILTAAGGAFGLLAALALGRLARSMLFELEAHDPAVLAVAAVSLALIALVAGASPAHRASRVEPMRALRYE